MTQFLDLAYIEPTKAYLQRQETLTENERTFSLGRSTTGAFRWMIDLYLEPARATDDRIRRLAAHVDSVGYATPFDLPMPQPVPYIQAGTVRAAAARAGATSIQITGTRPVEIPVGSYIGIGVGDESFPPIYRLTVPLTGPASGTRTAQITPGLRADVPANKTIVPVAVARVRLNPAHPIDNVFPQGDRGVVRPLLRLLTV